jgi:hypothetical protein
MTRWQKNDWQKYGLHDVERDDADRHGVAAIFLPRDLSARIYKGARERWVGAVR